jgi:hypothetical protein
MAAPDPSPAQRLVDPANLEMVQYVLVGEGGQITALGRPLRQAALTGEDEVSSGTFLSMKLDKPSISV